MDEAIRAFARTDYSLAPHTLYRIGGPARFALFPRSLSDMEAAYRWATAQEMPFIVLGAGSNILFDDRGYPGCVLFTTELTGMKALAGAHYTIGAGVLLGEMVRKIMLPNNYAGVGALTGIPGTVGGALFMNAGTTKGNIGQLTHTVTLLTLGGLVSRAITSDLYGYRGQSFCGRGEVIVEARFAFTASQDDENAVYQRYINRRRETQPQGWCCGSVFRNPPGDHAGRLIEAAGLKGTRHGGAVISEKHANFIMNDNNASFEDVLFLITHVKETVRMLFNVELIEEVCIVRHSSHDQT